MSQTWVSCPLESKQSQTNRKCKDSININTLPALSARAQPRACVPIVAPAAPPFGARVSCSSHSAFSFSCRLRFSCSASSSSSTCSPSSADRTGTERINASSCVRGVCSWSCWPCWVTLQSAQGAWRAQQHHVCLPLCFLLGQLDELHLLVVERRCHVVGLGKARLNSRRRLRVVL